MSKIESFFSSLKQAGEIAQKQALLKKKEMLELKDVYQQIGKYAFSHNIGREQLPDCYNPIDELDAQVQEAGRRESLDDTATIADKARHTAGRTKDRLTIEALLIKRKGLLAALGGIIACYEVEDETIVKLQKQARQIQLEINELKNSIERLQSETSFLARKPYLTGALALVGIFLVIGMVSGLSNGCGDAADRSEIQALEKENLATQKKIAQEELAAEKARKLEEEKDAAEQKKQELKEKQEQLAERQRQEAEARASEEEKKKREEDRKRKELEKQQALLAEQQRRDAEAKAREEAKKKAEDDRKIERQQKAAQEQKDRQAMAEAGFSAINLYPKVYMSKYLEMSGAKIEFTGKNWNKIKELHGKRDWLGLINLLTDTPLENNPPASPRRKPHGSGQLPPPNDNPNEYPPSYLIERAIKALNSEYELYVICRTTLKQDDYENKFTLITIDTDGRITPHAKWELHPDGGRYVVRSSLKNLSELAYVFYGDMTNTAFGTITDSLNDGLNALKEKHSMGEIDDDTLKARKEELFKRVRSQLINMAKTQSRKP